MQRTKQLHLDRQKLINGSSQQQIDAGKHTLQDLFDEISHAYDTAGPKAKEILWRHFEIKLHKFMKAKNIPETGFYTKNFLVDETDGAADEVDSDCEMLSELSATDTIDMVDDLDDDATDESTTKLDALKDACIEILKIQLQITDEEDMVS